MNDSKNPAPGADLARQLDRIEQVRERIVDIILVIICVVGLPSILLALPRSLEFGFRSTQFVVYGAFAANVIITILRSKIDFQVKAYFLVCLNFIIGATSCLDWGIFGFNSVFILTSVVIAGVLFGYRVGIAAAALGGAAIVTVGVLVRAGVHDFGIDFDQMVRSPSSWINALANLAYFCSILLIASGRLNSALSESISMLGKRTEDLEMFRAELQEEVLERSRAQEILTRSEQRYRLLAENATDVIWTLDLEMNISYVSPSIKAVFGYDPEEVIELGLSAIAPAEPLEMSESIMREELDSWKKGDGRWESRTFELKIIDKSGAERWTETSTKVMTGDQGGPIGFLGVTRDVTERKRLEQQLLQSQKMDAIGRLAGGVAHDFNNQLMVILNFAEMMKKSLPPEHPSLRKLEMIITAAEKSSALTSQLLAFSRKQVVSPKTISLNQVVEGLLPMLGSLLGETIAIETRLSPDLAPVRMDPIQVEQALINLAVNARDAMRGGGRLLIETCNVRLDADEIPPSGEIGPGEYVLLSVADTGEGMDEKIVEKAFEPFFTTKKEGEGTGLGLATVYGIVTQGGGAVGVRSSLGEGSVFSIYLPPAEGEPADIERRTEASPGGAGETILLVEDEPLVRGSLRMMLQDRGYRVIEAEGPEAALAIMGKKDLAFDLLVTDVVMPGQSGRDLARRARAMFPDLPIVFMSGYVDEVAFDKQSLEKREFFIQKPSSSDEFLGVVRKALDS